MTEPKRPSAAANNAPREARIVITMPARVSMSVDAAERHALAILAAVERARRGEAAPGDQVELAEEP